MNAREGDGKGSPADKENEDDDRSHWWSRRSGSLILPAQLFFELDALINRVTLKKYRTRRKKKKKKKKKKKETDRKIAHFPL